MPLFPFVELPLDQGVAQVSGPVEQGREEKSALRSNGLSMSGGGAFPPTRVAAHDLVRVPGARCDGRRRADSADGRQAVVFTFRVDDHAGAGYFTGWE